MIKHKNKIIMACVIIAILVLSFFWGENPPEQKKAEVIEENITVAHTHTEEKSVETVTVQEENQDVDEEETQPNIPDEQTEKLVEPEITEPVPQAETKPVTEKAPPPENPVTEDDVMTCSISVRCHTVLDNMENLDKSKHDVIPADGMIFENKNAVMYEGESIFNVLVRELKKNKIHFEYSKTPMYDSVYIEGIGNLYEFDCGELSGWLYRVNGISPGCGCSQYILKENDVIEFIYSCNMGKDISMPISGE